MKLTYILWLLLLPVTIMAQQTHGVVIDRFTRRPVAYATITTNFETVSANKQGQFGLKNMHAGDSIIITHTGYKPYRSAVNKVAADTLVFYIDQVSVMLRDVLIRATRNYKQDSLRNRQQFAAAFNYKAPGIMDVFSTVNPYAYTPYSYNTALNNTTAIVNVNLLSVISLLAKNKAPQSKLQQTLLRNEEADYIDRLFNKKKINAITGLKGDSLQHFMDSYRPSVKDARKMTDYDMNIYIRKSYNEFLKAYKSDSSAIPF